MSVTGALFVSVLDIEMVSYLAGVSALATWRAWRLGTWFCV